MKIECGRGWYIVRPAGLKLEVTYFDGSHVYCEDLRGLDYGGAADYCRRKIGEAA